MNDKPVGTITFLFTDIEGSTTLWENHPEQMKLALKRHDEIISQAIAPHGAYVFKTMGDAFHAAFSRAQDALHAALDAQKALAAEHWLLPAPIKVRMAIHSGSAELRDGDYYGQTLNRAARLLSSGHGGQTLISQAALELARDSIDSGIYYIDMGEHRLKDLIRPEKIYQIQFKGDTASFPPLNTLNNKSHNIPPQSTSFIGRQHQLDRISELFFPKPGHEAARLVTLLGTGGAGKTRLSLQWSAEMIDSFADGVWFVDLSPVTKEEHAFLALARTLDIEEKKDIPLPEIIKSVLKKRNILIILDNCEHIILTAARMAETLLLCGSGIRVLATSREILQIQGEHIVPVPPMVVPEQDSCISINEFSQYEAVRLFIERAQAIMPSFSVNNHNAPDIADICHRLDGVPLAIELAAVKIRMLPLEQIRERIKDPLALLTSGSRTATPRQQTLRGLIDWSYSILEQDEKELFARLSVFKSTFDIDAVEAICGK